MTDLLNREKSPNMIDPNMPRKLTDNEIKYILEVIPEIKSASQDVSAYNRASLIKTMEEMLREIIITPLAIEDLRVEILRQYIEALIAPGTVVGVSAAEALGQQITQGALNSFHQSGSSKNVTYGVSRLRELINASSELKTTSCSIFFKNQNLSVDDIILKARPELTEITVSDLVKGNPDIESTSHMEEPWWYAPYRLLIRNDFKANSVLKLSIDVNMLYAYKINMRDICKVIEQDRSTVICVYSPMNIGEIHIYPVEKEVDKPVAKTEAVMDKSNSSMIFLWNVVIPALSNLKITGILGIRQIYPVEAKVLQVVKDEKPVPGKEKMWYLLMNQVRIKITGITVDKLIKLCTICGIQTIQVDQKNTPPGYIVVITPDNESPLKRMLRLIEVDKEDEKKYEKARREEGKRVIRRPPTEIMTAANLVYADSDGSTFKTNKSTLRTLLSRPDIDSSRTFCNNVHEIKSVLGIEAARSFLIKEFSDVIGHEGGYINPRHIVLLVDFMVSLGEVNGITFSGISRQPIGALEKASFQNAMGTFAEASAFGEVKEVKGTSASIYVGKKPAIGTEFSSQFLDTSKFKEIEEEIVLNPDMQLDPTAFQDAIGEMTAMAEGADYMIMEGAEDEMFAGDGPTIPSTVFGDNAPPGFVPMFKPMPYRAPELEQAAAKLNQAPCLVPIPPPMVEMKEVPTTIPGFQLDLPTPNEAPPLPVLGLPSVLTEVINPMDIAPVIKPETKPKTKITFDLDEFLA
jgi:hypothetical protein